VPVDLLEDAAGSCADDLVCGVRTVRSLRVVRVGRVHSCHHPVPALGPLLTIAIDEAIDTSSGDPVLRARPPIVAVVRAWPIFSCRRSSGRLSDREIVRRNDRGHPNAAAIRSYVSQLGHVSEARAR
jgi:hypothetical protein